MQNIKNAMKSVYIPEPRYEDVPECQRYAGIFVLFIKTWWEWRKYFTI